MLAVLKNRVGCVFDELNRTSIQSVRLAAHPVHEMGIQQKLQSFSLNISSMSSLNGVLISSGTFHLPLAQPNSRFGFTPSRTSTLSGTSLATGFPALAITKLSPASTAYRCRERSVFVSCMFSVFMTGIIRVSPLVAHSQKISDMRAPGTYISLENLGRVRLSKHFFMRDFLYSEKCEHLRQSEYSR